MHKNDVIRTSIGWAVCCVLFCAILPLLVGLNTKFLGRDVSSIAAGVIEFYPFTAFLEVFKILACVGLVFFVMFAGAYRASLGAKSKYVRILICPGSVICSYLLFCAASALEYPALFEVYFHPEMSKALHFCAGYMSPLAVRLVALLVLLVPIVWFALIYTLPILFLLFFLFFPDRPVFGVQESRITEKPNILFIAIDSFRSDRASDPAVMPVFNNFLKENNVVEFKDHFIGVPRTFPSWVEIFQGKNAPRTGVRHMFPGFSERHNQRQNLVNALKINGYETIAVSDFAGDIFPRIDFGFDRLLTPTLNLETIIRMSVDLGFPLFVPLITTNGLRPYFASIKESPNFADPGHLTSQTLNEIDRNAGVKPLFLTLFYSTAHFPYGVPFPYYKMFGSKKYQGNFYFQKNPGIVGEKITEEDKKQIRSLYDGALKSIDDQLAVIFNYLKTTGLWNNTLIVVTADHGEDIYEDGVMQGHGEHLRGSNVLKVPLVMKFPTSIRSVRALPFVSRSIDIAPTIASFVGANVWDVDGLNWLPWITGRQLDNPNLKSYAETGIWFSRDGNGFFQGNRLDYPAISGMLSFDQGYSGEIVLNSLYDDVVVAAKHRALISSSHKLIYIPGKTGIEFEFYKRDGNSEKLLDSASEDTMIFEELKRELMGTISLLENPRRKILDGYVVRQ